MNSISVETPREAKCATDGCNRLPYKYGKPYLYDKFCESCIKKFFAHSFVPNYTQEVYSDFEVGLLQSVGFDVTIESYSSSCVCNKCWRMRRLHNWWGDYRQIYRVHTDSLGRRIPRRSKIHKNPLAFVPLLEKTCKICGFSAKVKTPYHTVK